MIDPIKRFPLLYFDKNGITYTKRIPKRKTKYTDPALWEKEFTIFLKDLKSRTGFDFEKLSQKEILKFGLFIWKNGLKHTDLVCHLPECNNLKRFNVNHSTLQKFCSHKCYAQHEPSKIKRKETMMENYNVDFYTQTQAFKDQYKKTMNENYGVDHNFQMLYQDLTQEEIQIKCNNRGNLTNEELYFDKLFIEKTFFDKDYFFKLQSFKSYFNVSSTAAHAQIKRLGCKWNKYPGFSSGEIWIKDILVENDINYKTEYVFEECINPSTGCGLRFDFYLPDFNICVEFDGAQHFQPVDHFGGVEAFEEAQKRDTIKENYCLGKGIKLIRVDYKFNIKEII